MNCEGFKFTALGSQKGDVDGIDHWIELSRSIILLYACPVVN